jgi:hypothetical protein
MKFFDQLKKRFENKKPEIKAEPRAKKAEKTAKEVATEKGEPYFDIVKMDLDPKDINSGSFEFDWNELFIARLVKAGYMMGPKDTDADIIDRWYTNVCRNVVLETYEQYEAMDPERDRVVKTRNIGDGRSEVS